MRKITALIVFLAAIAFPAAVLAAETFSVDAPESAFYNISVNYAATPGGGAISRSLFVNGEKAADMVSFKRYYADENKNYKTQKGNQTFPSQIEVTRYTDYILKNASGIAEREVSVWLEKGSNEVSLGFIEGDMTVSGVKLLRADRTPDYEQYKEANASVPKAGAELIKIQAEDALYKSNPSLYPFNDRADPLMEPYHPSNIVLNAIGGDGWRIQGDSVEWEITVPADGLYKIAPKYLQSVKRGAFVSRELAINGEIPFTEAARLRFHYDSSFRVEFLSDPVTGEEYWFYLKAGVNVIKLTATLGDFAAVAEEAQDALSALSAIYQDIIMVTSASPDKYRDYQIAAALPDVGRRLNAQNEALGRLLTHLNELSGSYSETTAIIERLRGNITKIVAHPDKIASYLADFKSSVSALATFITSSQNQSLQLDFICVGGEGAKLPKAKANFFQMLLHNILAFIGSFTNNYDESFETKNAEAKKNIEVWISTGRDIYNVLSYQIAESFNPKNPDVSVSLKLVSADVIFPASLTGRGPDVVLQTTPVTPMNFGYRDGAVDLAQFPDFDEIAAQFAPAAIETFEFEGAVWALPDQMSFDVMIYRTDIFEQLGLGVPNTMKEFLAIVPVLQKNYMDVYFLTGTQVTLGAGSGASNSGLSVGANSRNLNPVYVSFLYQMGGSLYDERGAVANVTSDAGVEAFKYWTELYTKHNFIVETNFETRFRVGEIPVGVVEIGVVNSLKIAAPEIRGKWAVAPIPGIEDKNGNIRRDNPISVSASLIVKNIAEKNGTVEESWRFLKWFVSDETQTKFSREVMAVWGGGWNYQTANLAAFERLDWGVETRGALMASLDEVRAIPQVPGGYIIGRVINNAFLSVVEESANANPTDAIYLARDQINAELKIKRKEFKLD